jgi:ribosomal protein S25
MSEDESEKVQPITKTLKIDKKYGKIVSVEVKRRDPFLPPSVEKRLRESLPKTKAITANNLAAKLDIRVSTIKSLLEDMTKEGLLDCVSSSSRLKVYHGKQVKK